MMTGLRRWASRRRSCLLALAAMYGFRLGAAWILALPVRYAVEASGVTQFPDGDRALYEAGGLVLLETLTAQRALIAASVGPMSLLFCVWAVASIGPEYLLMRALRSPSAERRLPGATTDLLRICVTALGLLPLRALVLGLTLAFAWSAHSWFAAVPDVRVADAAFVLVLALGGALQLAATVLRDLAASAVVRRSCPVPDAVRLGWSALRTNPARLASRYLLALGGAGMTYVAVAVLVTEVDMSRPGAFRALLVVALQQTAVLASILLRAWWLAIAGAAVSAQRDEVSRLSDAAPPQAEAFL